MTDEERKELDKLSKAEIIDLVGGLRDQKAELEKRVSLKQGENKKIIESFLKGASPADHADQSGDPLKGEAFNRLKKLFK